MARHPHSFRRPVRGGGTLPPLLAAMGVCLSLVSYASTRPRPPMSATLSPSLIENSKPSPARIVKLNGIPTLEADGLPLLVTGAQCDIWRSTRQDAKAEAFFQGYRDMNATTVSVGIPWSKIEPEKGKYDFRFLDWFVAQAEANDLKLVVNLFNSNVCGKVSEGFGPSAYPAYTPAYIVDHPEQYQRMVLPYPYKYVDAGPPMCPNDARTLERERLLVQAVAKHLRETDHRRTAVMLQIDNEFYYQQWEGARPGWESEEELAVRCQCANCLAKWEKGHYKNGEQFMFESFADYVRVLSDAIVKEYPIPLYVNSPWWQPRVIPIFLDRCPNLAFVGIDGILSPREPNWLSRSQLSRNLPFAAENPTENPEVRSNLDVLPYYTVIGNQGIGNLLWECHEPFTVVDDPVARRRYREALYPLKHAQAPIAQARGTDRLFGWFAQRHFRSDLTTDIFGNFVPTKAEDKVVQSDEWFVRQGASSRMESQGRFSGRLGDLTITVDGSQAGIVVQPKAGELILAVPAGRIEIEGLKEAKAEKGRFVGEAWRGEHPITFPTENGKAVFGIATPTVIRVTWRANA